MVEPSSSASSDLSTATKPIEESKDIFISYSSNDSEWVRNELLPQLEEAGLKVVIDYRDFTPGVPVMKNITEAVEMCRHTLAVVSPAYLDSEWTGLEQYLTGYADPAATQHKFIPLLLEPCEIPKTISWITCATLTDPAQRDQEMAQLLQHLGCSAQAIDKVTTLTARKGLVALSELMTAPAVRAATGDFKDTFAATTRQIEVLSRYKELHDFFQKAQGPFGLLFREKERLRKEEATWDELDESALQLEADIMPLLEYARRAFKPNEILWANKLERAQREVMEAIQDEDMAQLERPLERVHQVLGPVPSKLNHNMVKVAESLPLDRLVSRLELIRRSLPKLDFEREAEKRLDEFERGIGGLKKLHMRLTILISNHDCLQAIDDELNVHGDPSIHPPDADEIRDMWIDLSEMTGALSNECGASRIAQLRAVAAQLDAEVHRAQTAGDGEVDKAILKLFRNYRGKVKLGFNLANEDVKRLCGELQDVGRTLEMVLRRLQK